ncbi:MAG: GNAT family N-acetyltransferase [Sedimenticola sp.]|nr:GNAT family N-acetyltransferase [Sedimenticola sp.]
MQVVAFTESHRTALRRIYRQARRTAFHWLDGRPLLAEAFDGDTRGERIWVCEGGRKTLGFIAVWEREHFIHHLYVDPRYTGRGVGSLLLDHALGQIGRPAVLKCIADNFRARDFYLARGWLVVTEERGPDGPYLLMHYARR